MGVHRGLPEHNDERPRPPQPWSDAARAARRSAKVRTSGEQQRWQKVERFEEHLVDIVIREKTEFDQIAPALAVVAKGVIFVVVSLLVTITLRVTHGSGWDRDSIELGVIAAILLGVVLGQVHRLLIGEVRTETETESKTEQEPEPKGGIEAMLGWTTLRGVRRNRRTPASPSTAAPELAAPPTIPDSDTPRA